MSPEDSTTTTKLLVGRTKMLMPYPWLGSPPCWNPDSANYKRRVARVREIQRQYRSRHLPVEPLKLTTSHPQGIARKEVDCMKLTALLFFYWEFKDRVGTESEFEFINTSDSRFKFYSQLCSAYSALVRLSQEPNTSARALVDGFFNLLEKQQQLGMVVEESYMFDLRVLEYVANIGDKEGMLALIPPPPLPPQPQPQEPLLMNPKLGESATIRVSVPNDPSGGQVIEIAFKSSSENVGNEQMLSGKAGLERSDKACGCMEMLSFL